MTEETKTEQKTYTINGTEYRLREKYSLKQWGEILAVIAPLDTKKHIEALVVLMAEDKFHNLLNLILDKKIETELFEEDFEIASEVIKDFFSRKKGLIKGIGQPLKK